MTNESVGLELRVLDGLLAVCRLEPSAGIPDWAMSSPFLTLSRTATELSIVCDQQHVPEAVNTNTNWRAIGVVGMLDFSLTGILSSLTAPLGEAGISVFAISTFDTDYILVKEETLAATITALNAAGFVFA